MPTPSGAPSLPADPEVRDLRWEDGPALAQLYLSRFAEVDRDPDFGMRLPSGTPGLAEELERFSFTYRSVVDGDTVASVAVVADAVVGHATVRERSDRREDRRIGVLAMHVGEAHRNRGLGRALLGHVLPKSRARFEIVLLEVLVANVAARRLYAQFGFTTYGHLPKMFFREGQWRAGDLMWLDFAQGGLTSPSIPPA